MRIAYVGNFEPRHSTENHVKASLESIGHQVVSLQENAVDVVSILEAARQCDMFLYTRTWELKRVGDFDGLWLLEQLDFEGIPTVSYHLDLYIGLSDRPSMDIDPFWRTKYVFTPDGDPNSQMEFERLGINHIYLKPGVYGAECIPGLKRKEFEHDVIFVGSYDYHSEWPYRKELIDWLRATYGDRFAKYGYPDKTVRNMDLNDLYASAKVVVGDTLCLNFSHTNYWSDRVYETLGRGGFLIHPYISGMEEEFHDGVHLSYYNYQNFDMLRHLIDYFITNDEEREGIKRAGQDFVRNNCTYVHRVREMLKVLSDRDPRIQAALLNPTLPAYE